MTKKGIYIYILYQLPHFVMYNNLMAIPNSYGLAWSPHKHNANHLLSAGFDSKICQWDIAATPKENNELEPVRTYTAHTTGVEVSFGSKSI